MQNWQEYSVSTCFLCGTILFWPGKKSESCKIGKNIDFSCFPGKLKKHKATMWHYLVLPKYGKSCKIHQNMPFFLFSWKSQKTAVALCQNYPLNETRKHTSFTEIGSSMGNGLWLSLVMDGYSTLIVQWLKKLTHLASVAGYLVSLGAKSISTTCSHSPNKSWISDWRIPCFLAATALLTILMSRIFRGCSLVDAS